MPGRLQEPQQHGVGRREDELSDRPRQRTRSSPARRARDSARSRDGTSNTIMTVEVSDDKAVIWTKPDDWQFDPEKPLAGLGRAHPGGFCAAMCDGSIRSHLGELRHDCLELALLDDRRRQDRQPVVVRWAPPGGTGARRWHRRVAPSGGTVGWHHWVAPMIPPRVAPMIFAHKPSPFSTDDAAKSSVLRSNERPHVGGWPLTSCRSRHRRFRDQVSRKWPGLSRGIIGATR